MVGACDRAVERANGRLVLVVGPSGVGKDALIGGARERLSTDPRFVFPERIVTRQSTAAEHHGSIDEKSFADAQASGRFALSWRAHGLGYGVPASLDDDIAAGLTAVVNVSRIIVAAARARYARVAVVLVEAPLAVRAQRLGLRGRETTEEIADRLERQVSTFALEDADACIENSGTLDAGIAAFVTLLHDLHGFHGAAAPKR